MSSLQMTLVYGKEQYKDKTISSFMVHYLESLNEIIDYCCNYGKSEFTPYDLSYKSLTIGELNDLQSKYDIQDIYPLSPMQEGMLFHSLLDADVNSHLGQTSYRIKGVFEYRCCRGNDEYHHCPL